MTAYLNPMSAFLTAVQKTLLDQGIYTVPPSHAASENALPLRLQEAASLYEDSGDRILTLDDGSSFRMAWAKDELKRFQEAIPAALWNIEDLKPAEQWIRGTRRMFEQGDAEIVVHELVSTLADAITSSGLGLFETDENSLYGIGKTLENHDYSSSLAHRLAELIQRRLPFDLWHSAMEILKNWSASIARSEKNIFPLMETLVERGVISLANDDMENLSMFYEGSDPDKIQETLSRIVGDSRKEEAGFWLLITASFVGSCRNDGDLETFLSRFAQQRDRIRRLFSQLQEDSDLSLKMKAKIGGDLLTALQKSPPECADDLINIANVLLPALKMAAQGDSSLSFFGIWNNLPPEGLDAATFSKCLRFFEAVAIVAMFEPSVLERELSAAVKEVKQWHAEGRLQEMLDAREVAGTQTVAWVDAAEGGS